MFLRPTTPCRRILAISPLELAPLLRYAKDMTQSITLRRPDDWHLHLRDGDALRAVLPQHLSACHHDAA